MFNFPIPQALKLQIITVVNIFSLSLAISAPMNFNDPLSKFETRYSKSLPTLYQALRSSFVFEELDASEEQWHELRQSLQQHSLIELRKRNPRIRQQVVIAEETENSVAKPKTIEQILDEKQLFRLRQIRAQTLGVARDSTFGLTKFFRLDEPTKQNVLQLAEQHNQEFSQAARDAVKGIKQEIANSHRDFLNLLDTDQRDLFDDTFGPLMLRDDMVKSWIEQIRSTHAQSRKQVHSPFLIEHADMNIDSSVEWYLPTPSVIEELDLSDEQQRQLELILFQHKEKLDAERTKFYAGQPSRYARTGLILRELPLTERQKNRYVQLSRQNYARLDDDAFFGFENLQPFLSINQQKMDELQKRADALPKKLSTRCRVLIDDLIRLRKEQVAKTLRAVPDQIVDDYEAIFGEILFEPDWMNSAGVRLASPFNDRQ